VFLAFLFLGGCDVSSNDDIANECYSKLIEALNSNDLTKIESLFAKNIVNNINDFENQTIRLLDYYQGESVSYKKYSIGITEDKDKKIYAKYFNMSLDITTTEEIYRIATIWYVDDTNDNNNIGIWSLYIIKFSNDLYPEKAYGGDGLWTNGIHIGKN